MSDTKFIVASGPVIIEEGKVLLVQHGDDQFWKFPGGKWEEYDADLETTARREVKEELGLDIDLVAPLAPLLVRRDDGGAAVLIHYLAERHGAVVAGPDIRAWDWFSIDALPSDAAPNVSLVIADYKKRFAGRA